MNSMRIRRVRPAGFTLIELLVVITIIALLFSLTVGAFTYAQRSAARGRTSAGLTAMNSGLEQYKNDFGEYPEPSIPESTLEFGTLTYTIGGATMLYQALRGDGFDQIKIESVPADIPPESDGRLDEKEVPNVKLKDLPKELWRNQDAYYFMVDGFGHPFQYVKALQIDPTVSAAGQAPAVTVNTTYDLWSYAEDEVNTTARSIETVGNDTIKNASAKWIKNW